MREHGSLGDYYRYGGLLIIQDESNGTFSVDFNMPDGDCEDIEMDIFAWLEFINCLTDQNLRYLAITGGEPFGNMVLANDVALISKIYAPECPIVIFSHLRYEEIIGNPAMLALLKKCDYLVDGRLIDIRRSVETGEAVQTEFIEKGG